jgi:hypothetical protein
MGTSENEFLAIPESTTGRIALLRSLLAAELQAKAKVSDGIDVLFDTIIAENGLKNDAALCKLLEIPPPVMSKFRHRKRPLCASVILAIHERTGMPVARIRELAKDPS